jgi:hypothetical protein
MGDDEISEAGRQARFAQWEKLGLDEVKQDLATGGYRLIGGPPQVRALAREWVRIKEVEQLRTVSEALGLSTNPAIDALGLRETELDRLVNAAIGSSGSDHAPARSAPAPEEKTVELMTLKPTIYGVSIDLKEAGRRIRRLLQRRRKDKSG